MIKSKKFSLVQFVDDKIHYVCQTNTIRTNPRTTAVWSDKKRYDAMVLTSSDDKLLLKNLAENLSLGYPIVKLHKLAAPVKEFNCKPQNIKPVETGSLEGVSNDYEEFLVCAYCGTLVLEGQMDSHIRSLHGEIVQEPNVVIDTKVKYSTKKHCCVYCGTLQAQLPRHLERVHQNEEDVKEAMKIKKGSPRRKLLFESLQKKGDFIYNSQNEFLITHRRSQIKSSNSNNYVACPYCKGFYSKVNLYNHVRRNCRSIKIKIDDSVMRNLQTASRATFPQIHENACQGLRAIFPKLIDDEITKAVRNDLHVIEFANLLVTKYSTSAHHDKMIRNKLRHLGRIILEMRKLNSTISDMKSIFKPQNFDNFIKALHNIAGLNNGKFVAPSFGPTSITLMRKMGGVIEAIAIKENSKEGQTDVENFLKLLHTMGNSLVSKIAIENRTQQQRSKKVILPKTEDINELYELLTTEIENCMNLLENGFVKTRWIILSKVTLVHLMVFNRKRPGDVEKTQVTEYKTLETVPPESVTGLDGSQKDLAQKFGRYVARGKLDSPAPLLVSEIDMSAIERILYYRKKADIDKDNPYLFAQPPGGASQFFSAGLALKEFCIRMGLEDKNLTATKLRKHLATVTGTLSQEKIHMVSDFMGHSIDIHKKIYNQRAIVSDICEMGSLLLGAVGKDDKTLKKQVARAGTSKESTTILNPNQQTSVEDYCMSEPGTSKQSNTISITDRQLSAEDYCTTDGTSEYTMDQIGYEPDLSTIQEGNTSPENNTIMIDNIAPNSKRERKRKIKTSEYGIRKIGRKSTWTTPERHEARKVFKHYLNENCTYIPNAETCQVYTHENSILKNRTSFQIRAWIRAEQKRKLDQKETSRRGWTTPINDLCRKRFRKFYECKIYPDFTELQEAIDTEPLLSGTTMTKLRSHLQHDFKYLKENRRIQFNTDSEDGESDEGDENFDPFVKFV